MLRRPRQPCLRDCVLSGYEINGERPTRRRWLRVTVLSIGLVIGILAMAAAAASAQAKPPEPQPPLDLSVDSVEVTQATQTPANTIPLVARKSAAVRAYIGVDAPAPVPAITGRLHVFVNGSEVTPAGGVPPIKAITTWGSSDRNKENDTLNFELPAPTAITASTDVDFRVTVTPKPSEKNTANNSRSTNNLTAVDRRAPFIYFTRIDYTPAGSGRPPLSNVAPGTGDAFVRGILPVDDSAKLLYRETTPLTFSCDPNGNGRLGATDSGICNGKDAFEQTHLLNFLESARQMIVSDGLGANDRTFLYGWITGNPIDGNGAAFRGWRTAFGNTQDDLYQRTFAHELGHDFGLGHNDRTGPDAGLDEVGWDVGARLVGNPPGNNETTRVKPITTPVSGPDFDIMTTGDVTVTPAIPSPRTNEAWINTKNYKFLLNHCTLRWPDPQCPTFELEPKKKVAVLRGLIAPARSGDGRRAGRIRREANGSKLLQLDPVFRFPWASEASRNSAGRFLAEITDTNGVTTTDRFDIVVGGEDEQTLDGAFSAMLPVDPNAEIRSLRVMNADRTVQLAEMRRSKPPRIRIVSPRQGTVLGRDDRERDDRGGEDRGRDDREGETSEVRWTIDDPDTPDSQLRFEAAYSNDEGRSWVPIGVDIPGTDRAFTFDSSEIPESDGEGVIRVFVSDGLNTAFDDVTVLNR